MREERDGTLGKADQLEELEHPGAEGWGGRPLVDDQRLADDRADPHPGIERRVRVLEHGLHRSPIAAETVAVEPHQRRALKLDLAARRRLDVEDHPGRRRLAAPRLADEAERLARLDRERDGVHGAHESRCPSKESPAYGEVLRERRRLEERGSAHAGASSQHRLA